MKLTTIQTMSALAATGVLVAIVSGVLYLVTSGKSKPDPDPEYESYIARKLPGTGKNCSLTYITHRVDGRVNHIYITEGKCHVAAP